MRGNAPSQVNIVFPLLFTKTDVLGSPVGNTVLSGLIQLQLRSRQRVVPCSQAVNLSGLEKEDKKRFLGMYYKCLPQAKILTQNLFILDQRCTTHSPHTAYAATNSSPQPRNIDDRLYVRIKIGAGMLLSIPSFTVKQ